MTNHTTIAIIGGSFGGLSALIKLRKRLGKKVLIKLFDSRDHFCYIPALHETILGSEDRKQSIQFSLKKYYGNEFIHEGVVSIADTMLITQSGEQRTFDYAVIATGSRTNFFGNLQRKKNALAVRYIDDIPEINKRLILQETKNITVIGGGYTGVEVASIIAERKRDDQTVRIVHSGTRLFNRLSEKISELSINRLQGKGTEVILGDRVHEIGTNDITLNSGKIYSSDLTIISTGVALNNELISPEITFNKKYSSTKSPHIYTCGDVASHGLYTTAHNAMMEGRRVGDLIANNIEGINVSYHPLKNWDKLAIALGSYDGIFTNGTKGIYLPRLTGLSKRIIEKRVLIEFKRKILFRI